MCIGQFKKCGNYYFYGGLAPRFFLFTVIVSQNTFHKGTLRFVFNILRTFTQAVLSYHVNMQKVVISDFVMLKILKY